MCLSSLGENQSFVSGKRNLSRLPAPTSRAFQPVLTNVVAAPQAPTSSSASSSYATVERSRQTPQSISPRQPYTGSTSQNQSSSTGHAGHSTGASQYYDLTESACNGNDSNTHRNATTLSNSLSSSDQKGSYLQERDIRYGNGAVGTDHIAEHNTRHAEHDSALLQQQRQQHSLQQLQYQQQQLQQQQRQQYEQNKQQSEQYQYQQSSYWNSVMERTSGSARPAHPIMTRDEQYRSISNSQSNRNHGAHADSLNDHQAQGGYSFRQTDGPASSSVGSWAHPTADQNHPLQHSNELSVTHPDYTYQQHAFIPNGNSTQTGSANGHCPSPQSKNASHSNNSSSEKKRKREKLQYVNFVQKSIQSDFKRQKASCDGSYDRFQDHSNGQIKSNGQDQRSRSGSLKDESGFISVKDPSYNKNEHRQNQNGTALAALLPSSSQSHISYALYDSAPTLPGNRYSDHSSSVPSDGSSSSQVSLGSRPQGSIPQSDNDLAVLLLAISGTPSQISAPSLSLPTLDLNSFTSNMDKHYPSNHSDHKASYAHQSHIGGDVAVKHMNSPPQLLDPL